MNVTAINATSITVGQILSGASGPLLALSPVVMIVLGILMLLFIGKISKLVIQVIGALLIIVGVLSLLSIHI